MKWRLIGHGKGFKNNRPEFRVWTENEHGTLLCVNATREQHAWAVKEETRNGSVDAPDWVLDAIQHDADLRNEALGIYREESCKS